MCVFKMTKTLVFLIEIEFAFIVGNCWPLC